MLLKISRLWTLQEHTRKFKYTILKIKYLHSSIYITFLHISINNLTQSLSSLKTVLLLKRNRVLHSIEIQFGSEERFSFQACTAALCRGVSWSQGVCSGGCHWRTTALLRVSRWVACHLVSGVCYRTVVVAIVISCRICNKRALLVGSPNSNKNTFHRLSAQKKKTK